MRIAISGSHFTGKSTLIETLSKQLPNYLVVEEPYFLLEDEGYTFSSPPVLEDYRCQFNYSISLITESKNDTFFDRCPLDFLAYASTIKRDISLDSLTEELEKALELLDLIVFLPIEYRDKIFLPSSQNRKLRLQVNENLQGILLDDDLMILKHTKVLEVTGSLEKRLTTVLQNVGKT